MCMIVGVFFGREDRGQDVQRWTSLHNNALSPVTNTRYSIKAHQERCPDSYAAPNPQVQVAYQIICYVLILSSQAFLLFSYIPWIVN